MLVYHFAPVWGINRDYYILSFGFSFCLLNFNCWMEAACHASTASCSSGERWSSAVDSKQRFPTGAMHNRFKIGHGTANGFEASVWYASTRERRGFSTYESSSMRARTFDQRWQESAAVERTSERNAEAHIATSDGLSFRTRWRLCGASNFGKYRTRRTFWLMLLLLPPLPSSPEKGVDCRGTGKTPKDHPQLL